MIQEPCLQRHADRLQASSYIEVAGFSYCMVVLVCSNAPELAPGIFICRGTIATPPWNSQLIHGGGRTVKLDSINGSLTVAKIEVSGNFPHSGRDNFICGDSEA